MVSTKPHIEVAADISGFPHSIHQFEKLVMAMARKLVFGLLITASVRSLILNSLFLAVVSYNSIACYHN